VALEIDMAVNHSTYDTMYLAFAIAMGARGVVLSDKAFVRDMETHLDRALAALLVPLDAWAASIGLA
jgi:predicted nucleic acid-binding protein